MMTLHEAIEKILQDAGHAMTTTEIAAEPILIAVSQDSERESGNEWF